MKGQEINDHMEAIEAHWELGDSISADSHIHAIFICLSDITDHMIDKLKKSLEESLESLETESPCWWSASQFLREVNRESDSR